jgi:hypothetical protein
VARNACGLALLVAFALAGCSTFSNKKEEEAAQAAAAKLATIRARTDSLRKARHLADSLAQVHYAACLDSVRFELGKAAAFKPKGKKKKKAQQAALSEESILAKAGTACTEMGLSQPSVAMAAPSSVAPAADGTGAPVQASTPPTRDSMQSSAVPTPASMAAPAAVAPPSVPANAEAIAAGIPDSIVYADSVRKAKEIEMSRETFSYGGAARDPFNSLLNMAKNGPELADLMLVGIYQNLRAPASSVAVFREKEGGKRHKLRAGDQVGRSRLVQIRERDVVFMIEDFGFERQETLSLRKQEDVIQ